MKLHAIHSLFWAIYHISDCCYVLFELQVGDELLYINGVSTVGMSRSDAITLIKQGGDVVKLIIPRVIKQLAV